MRTRHFSIARRARAALAAAALIASPCSAGAEPWRLWPSPWDGGEPLDQAQTESTPKPILQVMPDRPVRQTFTPARTPLLRIDLLVNNRYDPRPGQIRLYRWLGNTERTLRQPPVWEDWLPLGGDVTMQLRSVFPRIEVEAGAPYLIELRAEGRDSYKVDWNSGQEDRYTRGRLVSPIGRGPAATRADLWFRTFAGVPDVGHDLPLHASQPRLSWSEPGPMPTRTPRSAYLERIRAHSRARRAGFLKPCRDHLHQAAPLEAILYRASCLDGQCDENHARALRDIFRNADEVHGAPTPGEKSRCPLEKRVRPDAVRFWWLEPAVLGYAEVRNSPSLSPGDHREIRELLVRNARHLWARREHGVHNRSLRLAVGYLAMTQLFPDVPESREWKAYAESIWNEFWGARDTMEDSAQYTDGIGFPSILQYAALSGRDSEVWGDAGFLDFIDRIYQRIAPLGIDPNFGDGSGWARDPGGLIWIFEKAASRTGDHRYKWLANQLYQYNATRLTDLRPREDSLHASLPYLGLAWLDADDSIPSTPPPERRSDLAARQDEGAEAWPLVPGAPLGQTFVAASGPLVRIDLRLKSAGQDGRALITLWRWRGSPTETRRAPAVWQEARVIPESSDWQTFSAYPFAHPDAEGRYYVEIEALAPSMSIAGSAPGRDAYADGQLVRAGDSVAADLWFAAHTLVGRGSSVLMRPATASRPRSQWGPLQTGRIRFTGESVPDKLVLRSGNRPEDLFAMVNLLTGYMHGQQELGAFVTLLDGGSVLLADTPFPYAYHQGAREDESAALVRRYWGGSPRPRGREARITHFADGRNVTVAWIEYRDSEGSNVDQERRIILVKNRMLWVRDRFRFHDAMAASVGPVWHSGDVHPGHGEHWWDFYYRAPQSNGWQVRNPRRHALLYFVPRASYRASAFLQATYLPPAKCKVGPTTRRVRGECRSGPPYVLAQRWNGETKPGQDLWFDSLVLPHAGRRGPGQIAGDVRVLHSDERRTVLEVKLGEETWILADHPSETLSQAGPLRIDARYAIARLSSENEPYLFAREATRVEGPGIDLRWSSPSDVEIGGWLPVDRLTR